MNNKLRVCCALAVLSLLNSCAVTEKDTLASLGELSINIEKDAVVGSAREKAMDSYSEFMASVPKDSLKVEALRRLADLELERSEERYEKQIAELDTAKQRETESAKIAQIKQDSYKKAIELYESAINASAGKIDDAQVFYQLSKAYEQAGKPRKALDALDRLLARFPDLENRDEVHFRRGELFFSFDEFENADRAYTQAMVVNPSSAFYEKALSKKGWSAYRQNKYDRALHSFFTLADRKLRGQSGKAGVDNVNLSRGDKELLKDIYRVITLSFNELGGAKAVTDYFDNNSQRWYESQIYKNLGDHYLSQKRIRDAANAYHAFVEHSPFHALAPDFDMYRIKAFARGGFPSLLMKAKINFAKQYQVNGEYWKKQGEDVHNKLTPLLQKNIEEVAQHYHAQAQKSKKPADYVTAIVWYKQYIKNFRKSAKAPRMNFLLAEMLSENKQFEAAAKEFEKTAYQYPKYGKNAEAGYAALLAYSEQAKRLNGKQKEIWERLTIASALRFGKAFPDDKRAPSAVTKAAEDLFALKKYEQAAVAARSILELTGGTTPAMRRTAWLIVAQAELQSGHYARAESAYKIAIRLTKPGNAQRKAIEEGLAASIYKQGEQARAANDHQSAVDHFARVVLEAPNTDIAISAQFDLAASYVAKQSWNAAIKTLQRFRQRYPQHRLSQKVTENLAVAYVKSKQPIAAAQEFKTMIDYQTDVDVRRELAWRIAELYEEAGARSDTITAYKQFVDTYPKPAEQALEAQQKLADIYLSINQVENRRYWLRQIIESDESAGSGRSDRTQYLAAKAALELAEPHMSTFQRVKLVAPLKENLKKKKQRMQEAVDAYTKAANYGVEEVTTASVYWLAEIYNEFGRELLNSERPSGLSQDEREQYDILLEEQAFPFEEKSMDIHETNAKRIVEGVYDEWVKKSIAVLSVLQPVRYAKSERSELFADVIY
ncbi:MAG: tetratricopeptide repeat protein [Gammaproteobacteria bacterium]|nr:tetratricopeptide repeat protein [Gammaproteobacteria bacterium]